MASQAFKRGPGSDLSLNMTPMIDCVFQLILFFILTTQAASLAIERLDLHRPYKSQARSQKEVGATHKVIVNVLSAEPKGGSTDPMLAGMARTYMIDGEKYAIRDIEGLVEVFEKRKAVADSEDKQFYLEIRADKKVFYAEVQNVMAAATRARIPKMNIAAMVWVE